MAEFVISTQSPCHLNSGPAQPPDSSALTCDRSKLCAKWNLVYCYTYPPAYLLGIVPVNQLSSTVTTTPTRPGAPSAPVADVLFWLASRITPQPKLNLLVSGARRP